MAWQARLKEPDAVQEVRVEEGFDPARSEAVSDARENR